MEIGVLGGESRLGEGAEGEVIEHDGVVVRDADGRQVDGRRVRWEVKRPSGGEKRRKRRGLSRAEQTEIAMARRQCQYSTLESVWRMMHRYLQSLARWV